MTDGLIFEECGKVNADDVVVELSGSLQTTLRFEQQNLWKKDDFRDNTAGSDFASGYLPERGAVFRLPCFWVKRRYLYAYGCWDERPVFRDTVSGGYNGLVLLPIHPSEIVRYSHFLSHVGAHDAAEDGLHVWATPTSSVRTLLAWPEGRPEAAFFAKLSLSCHLLGDRRLTRKRVAGSVGLSDFVFGCGSELPSGLVFLREPLGVTPRCMPDRGALFRAVPEELQTGAVLAPLFALMGGNEASPPLALQLLENYRGDALEVLEQVLLAKFARLWVDLVFDCGLILEAHGQDLLLSLSPDLVPLGVFYYRDFEGLAVDWSLRSARGLAKPEWLPHDFEWFSTYETWGYPLYQLVSTKMRTSLTDYVQFVLCELETALLAWQAKGLVTGTKIVEGELTFLFSRYLRSAIQNKFGMREPHEYDIRHQRNRFVKFLMSVRRNVVNS